MAEGAFRQMLQSGAPGIRRIFDWLTEKLNTPGSGFEIALGRSSANLDDFAARVGGLSWKEWESRGVVSDIHPNNFKPAFTEAADNARVIHFNLDELPLSTVLADGARGFNVYGNTTAAELHMIVNTQRYLDKTVFYLGGKPMARSDVLNLLGKR